MSTQRLEAVARATFGADGTATAAFQTVQPWKRWRVNRTAVSSTSANLTAVSTYRNTPGPANLIDAAAYSGNGDSSDTAFVLEAGETLTVQWTGGTPGATATATVSGEFEDA